MPNLHMIRRTDTFASRKRPLTGYWMKIQGQRRDGGIFFFHDTAMAGEK